MGFDYAQCGGGCNGRIDGIAAAHQDLDPGLGGQGVPRGHHAIASHHIRTKRRVLHAVW